MVRDGHTLCVSVKLKTKASIEQVTQALANYQPLPGARAVLLGTHAHQLPHLDDERC